MKFRHKCEFNGCRKAGSRRLKNGHWVCDEHYRYLLHMRKTKKHNRFLKEIHVASIRDQDGLGKPLCIYTDVLVKY